MAAKRERGQSALRDLQRDTAIRGLVSCPDCGLICRRHVAKDWDGELYGWTSEALRMEAVEAVGFEAALAQGVEYREGRHRCPPIAPLALLSSWLEDPAALARDLGVPSVEGGVWCGPS